MQEQFYKDCIIEDRESWNFLDFNEEQWFKQFIQLTQSIGALEGGKKQYGFCLEISWKIREIAIDEKFRNNFSFSQVILDFFILNYFFMCEFLDKYKTYEFGNVEDINKKEFPIVNLPIIRMMDYFLKQKAFRQLGKAIQKLEMRYIIIWFELTYKEIDKSIRENLDCQDVLFIFTKMSQEGVKKYFKHEYIPIIEKAPYEAIYKLIENSNLEETYINNDYFLKAFIEFNLERQIQMLELLEDKEYDSSFIEKLHGFINKVEITDKKMSLKQEEMDFEELTQRRRILTSVLEMSTKKHKKIKDIIENSSYFKKHNVKNNNLWKIISLDENYELDLSYSYYSEIMDLYNKCREYATKSIVESLYPLNKVSSNIVHLYDEHYNILVRVRTLWEMKELAETFKVRTFCSFIIITEKNMSHYGNSVLYGYYTNITSDLIAHIYPIDSLSHSGAKKESQLTNRMNMLLDIDDLNQASLDKQTYNQLCIRTKDQNGNILWPDCIVCIEDIDEESRKIANSLGLNIVVLHKRSDTIEQNEDIHKNLK